MNKDKILMLLIEGEEPILSPKKRSYVSKHYDFTIAIGKDYCATITIDEDSYAALLATEGESNA